VGEAAGAEKIKDQGGPYVVEIKNGITWARWAIPVVTLVVGIGGYVFSVGEMKATYDQRFTRLEADVQQARSEFARKDVFESRLTMIEKAQERIEENEKEQARKLDEILMVERKRSRP